MEETVYTLQQLLTQVREAIDDSFPLSVWVKGEIQGMSVNRSGHCYLNLIEKNILTGALLAEVRAIIWSSRYRSIAVRFEQEAGRRLEDGMNILVRATVQFSELYGLSLIIEDVDAAFTAGEAFLERQRTIRRLEEEGMMELNSQLALPTLPRRFAVISAATAAGYGDFMEHLHNNGYGFKFYSELFPAPLQGADAPEGIIAALEAVAERSDEFDAVLLLRGGGSATDLACFDSYDLALNISQFPLPVLTAIGHERDVHVADMVAFEHLKTPTALADYFVDIIAGEDYQLRTLAGRLSLAVRTKAADQRARLERSVSRIRTAAGGIISAQRQKVDLLEYRIGALNPASILAKGFSLTLKDGARVVTSGQLAPGDNVTILLSDGSVKGKIL